MCTGTVGRRRDGFLMVTRRHTMTVGRATPSGVRRVVPWLVSIGVHVGLVVLGLAVTWTVLLVDERDGPERITADFEMLEYRPVTATSVTTLEAVVAAPTPVAVVPPMPIPEAIVDGSTLDLDALLGSPELPEELLPTGVEGMPVIEFAGVRATNARRIVYVVDASGSMVTFLQIVLDELFRSLEQLDERQQFAIIFYNRRITEVPPRGRLQKATSAARRRAIEWINTGDHVLPGPESNPVAALERAFDLHPEVIFLLSDSITGSGAHEVEQASLLASLDALNPIRDARTGRRDVLIRCVQFLGEPEDEVGTMRRIAQEHGGADGYTVYDRKAMGLED